VSTEHTNLPRSSPHTRVTGYEPPHSYHHMFTPSMNLPTHGTTSPDLSRASLLSNITHRPLAATLSPSADRLAVHASLPGATLQTDPLFQGLSPGKTHLAARRHAMQECPWRSYRLTHLPMPPGAISVANPACFWHPTQLGLLTKAIPASITTLLNACTLSWQSTTLIWFKCLLFTIIKSLTQCLCFTNYFNISRYSQSSLWDKPSPSYLTLKSLLSLLHNDTNTFPLVVFLMNPHNSYEFLNQFNTSFILQPSSIISSKPKII